MFATHLEPIPLLDRQSSRESFDSSQLDGGIPKTVPCQRDGFSNQLLIKSRSEQFISDEEPVRAPLISYPSFSSMVAKWVLLAAFSAAVYGRVITSPKIGDLWTAGEKALITWYVQFLLASKAKCCRHHNHSPRISLSPLW